MSTPYNTPPGTRWKDIDPPVCPRCNGFGMIERCDATQDEINSYFDEGQDEVLCPECHGSGVLNSQ